MREINEGFKDEIKSKELNQDDIDIDKRLDFSKIFDKLEEKMVKTDMSIKNDIDVVDKLENYNKISESETDKEVLEQEKYYDDNGKLYRKGDELVPYSTYEINGYNYKTDGLGRIEEAFGELQIKGDRPRMPIKDSMDVIGKGDQLETDDRGHLFADMFNGSNGLENLIPQDAHLNKSEYKQMENQLYKEVDAGKDVTFKLDIHYPGESHRPDYLVATYSINGEINTRFFENKIGD